MNKILRNRKLNLKLILNKRMIYILIYKKLTSKLQQNKLKIIIMKIVEKKINCIIVNLQNELIKKIKIKIFKNIKEKEYITMKIKIIKQIFTHLKKRIINQDV